MSSRDFYSERVRSYPPFERLQKNQGNFELYKLRAVERDSRSFRKVVGRILQKINFTLRILKLRCQKCSPTSGSYFWSRTRMRFGESEIPEDRSVLPCCRWRRIKEICRWIRSVFEWTRELIINRSTRSIGGSRGDLREGTRRGDFIQRWTRGGARRDGVADGEISPTTPTTGAQRRDNAARRLQSSSCFGPLNSSWEMKPFLSLSSCWKISSTSLSWSDNIFFTSSFSPLAWSASICFRK